MSEDAVGSTEKQFKISPYKTHIPTVEDYFRSDEPDPSVPRPQEVEDSESVQAALAEWQGLGEALHRI